jgi:zinc transporter ZupT
MKCGWIRIDERCPGMRKLLGHRAGIVFRLLVRWLMMLLQFHLILFAASSTRIGPFLCATTVGLWSGVRDYTSSMKCEYHTTALLNSISKRKKKASSILDHLDCSLMAGEIRSVILAQLRPHRVQVRYLHAGPTEGRTKLFVSSKVQDPCNFRGFGNCCQGASLRCG